MLNKYSLRIFTLVLISAFGEAKYDGYRFKLDIGNPNILCPEPTYKCSDGSSHFLCNTEIRSHSICICHNTVPLNDTLIKTFLEATNGIRNKVAADLQIANMNLVYWSSELMEMANYFLRLCNRTVDECLVVGENKIAVSQNTVFYEGELVERWPGRMVRHWYYEMGKGNITTFADYVRQYKKGQIANLTKLAHPLVEFVGCGAARLATGYYIICYYHPPLLKENFPGDYALGEPCSKCSPERTVVSKTFLNLCGIDFEWNTQCGICITANNFLFFMCFSFVMFLTHLD